VPRSKGPVETKFKTLSRNERGAVEKDKGGPQKASWAKEKDRRVQRACRSALRPDSAVIGGGGGVGRNKTYTGAGRRGLDILPHVEIA